MSKVENKKLTIENLSTDERYKKICQKKVEWVLELIKELDLPSDLMDKAISFKDDEGFLIHFHHEIINEEFKDDIKDNALLKNLIRFSQNIIILRKNQRLEELYNEYTKNRLVLIYAMRFFILENRNAVIKILKDAIHKNAENMNLLKHNENINSLEDDKYFFEKTKLLYPEINKKILEDLNAVNYIEKFIEKNLNTINQFEISE